MDKNNHIDVPGNVVIRPVSSASDLKVFIDVPWTVYADDPVWVPPLRLERRLHFSRFNPFLKHGEWQAWIACKDHQPVGRISAQIDFLHRERYGPDTGHFGLLECIEDSAVFSSLIRVAENWLRERNTRQVTGPFNLSINQECGVLVDGFETPPVVMMPHSPRWYGRMYEENGYQPRKDLLAYWVDIDFEAPKAMTVMLEKYARRIHMRAINRNRLSEEIEILRDIFNDGWSDNWGFVPITREEFAELGSIFRLLVPEDYIQIAEVDGKPVAFMASLPNLNEIFAELNGDLFPFGWVKLVRKIREQSFLTGRVPLMGVRKQFHNTTLGAALVYSVVDATRKCGLSRGAREVEMSWILEDNKPMRNILDSIGSKQYKRYRIYGKTL